MIRRLAVVLVLFVVAAVCSQAQAQSLTPQQRQQIQQQIVVYQQYISRYGNDPRLSGVISQMRSAIAQYQQLLNTSRPSPSSSPSPSNSADQVRQIAERQRTAALNFVSTNRPGPNGFVIYFSQPPIYAGGQFTAAARPYYAQTYEVVRVINMLANNGNAITGISRW